MSAPPRPATPADLPRLEQLLRASGLITAGVADHIEEFVVVEEAGRIVASAGLERYGTAGLLRSVAVAPEQRNRGLARALITRLLDSAPPEMDEVFLFTATAPDYFRRFGFRPIPRDEVADPVRASEEYGECCAGATAMRLRLRREQRRVAAGPTGAGREKIDDPSR